MPDKGKDWRDKQRSPRPTPNELKKLGYYDETNSVRSLKAPPSDKATIKKLPTIAKKAIGSKNRARLRHLKKKVANSTLAQKASSARFKAVKASKPIINKMKKIGDDVGRGARKFAYNYPEATAFGMMMAGLTGVGLLSAGIESAAKKSQAKKRAKKAQLRKEKK